MLAPNRDLAAYQDRGLLFSNGNLITLDPARPRATILAAQHGRIVYVGSSRREAQRQLRGRFSEHDLGGATMVPGFNDAHCHVLKEASYLAWLDFRAAGATTIEAICGLIRERASNVGPASWILGHAYDHVALPGGAHPTREHLDAAAPDNPVLLRHMTGHVHVANSRALELAGVGPGTPDPAGGRIVRHDAGRPTGVLEETAFQLVRRVIPPPDPATLIEQLQALGRLLASEGVTTVQDAGVGGLDLAAELSAIRAASESGAFRQRTSLNLLAEPVLAEDPDPLRILAVELEPGRAWLGVGGVKIVADGSLVARTAALSEDYLGQPGNRGFLRLEPAELRALVAAAHRRGWTALVHAIGDRAIDEALAAFEAAPPLPSTTMRDRIEHCGVVRPDLLPRMRRAGVVIVTQPQFVSAMGDGYIEVAGVERCRSVYPIASLLTDGIPVAGSSDRPVVSGAPMLGIHDAVNETTASGQPFAPGERVSAEEGIALFTTGAAYAEGQERVKGRLKVGQVADLVVLDRDPTAVEPQAIASIEVQSTTIGGAIVWHS